MHPISVVASNFRSLFSSTLSVSSCSKNESPTPTPLNSITPSCLWKVIVPATCDGMGTFAPRFGGVLLPMYISSSSKENSPTRVLPYDNQSDISVDLKTVVLASGPPHGAVWQAATYTMAAMPRTPSPAIWPVITPVVATLDKHDCCYARLHCRYCLCVDDRVRHSINASIVKNMAVLIRRSIPLVHKPQATSRVGGVILVSYNSVHPTRRQVGYRPSPRAIVDV